MHCVKFPFAYIIKLVSVFIWSERFSSLLMSILSQDAFVKRNFSPNFLSLLFFPIENIDFIKEMLDVKPGYEYKNDM